MGLPLTAALQSIAGPVASAVPFVVMGATAVWRRHPRGQDRRAGGPRGGSAVGGAVGAVGGTLYTRAQSGGRRRRITHQLLTINLA